MSEHDDHTQSVTDPGPSFMKLPLNLSRNPHLSFGAKILYCRLALYAGKDGQCNPSQATLAAELGIESTRQIRRYLDELLQFRLIQWNRTRASSSYTVYDCKSLRPDNNVLSDRTDMSSLDRTETSNKKRSLNRGSSVDVRDLDGPFSGNRKRADEISKPKPVQSPEVSKMLALYRTGGRPPQKSDYPSDVTTAEIVHAAKFKDEKWIVDELLHLHNVRHLYWGTENGPRSFLWFKTVLEERAEASTNRGDARLSRWDFDGTRKAS